MLKKLNSLTNTFYKMWARTITVSRPFYMFPLFWLLCFFEFFYRIIFFSVRFFRGLKKPYQSRFPIISIGNIVVGGVGKTVAVELVVEMLKKFNPAVIVSGYGRTGNDDPGDEARMLAEHLSVPIIVAESRARGAQMLEDACDEDPQIAVGVIVLDDGYQHQTLKKDLEILVVDARAPFDNGHLLPAGRLREKDISRAHLFLFTHVASLESYENALQEMHVPPEKSFAFRHKLINLHDVSNEQQSLESLRGKKIFAVAAIGDTQQFFDMLRDDTHAYIEREFPFIDHYVYTMHDIEHINAEAEAMQVDVIVTTAKDWSKIKPLLESSPSRQMWRVALVNLDGLTHNEPARLSTSLADFIQRQSAA